MSKNALCFLLEVLWFLVLQLSLHFECVFIYGVKKCSNFIYVKLSRFLSTTCWRDFLFYIAYSSLICCRLLDNSCLSLFLGSLFDKCHEFHYLLNMSFNFLSYFHFLPYFHCLTLSIFLFPKPLFGNITISSTWWGCKYWAHL